LLDRIVRERLLTLRGVYGFWPANTIGEDVVVFRPGSGSRDQGSKAVDPRSPIPDRLTFNMLRQQEAIGDGRPNRSLADFIAPVETGMTDYVGAFAVTAGIGANELVAHYESDHDDYH